MDPRARRRMGEDGPVRAELDLMSPSLHPPARAARAEARAGAAGPSRPDEWEAATRTGGPWPDVPTPATEDRAGRYRPDSRLPPDPATPTDRSPGGLAGRNQDGADRRTRSDRFRSNSAPECVTRSRADLTVGLRTRGTPSSALRAPSPAGRRGWWTPLPSGEGAAARESGRPLPAVAERGVG